VAGCVDRQNWKIRPKGPERLPARYHAQVGKAFAEAMLEMEKK